MLKIDRANLWKACSCRSVDCKNKDTRRGIHDRAARQMHVFHANYTETHKTDCAIRNRNVLESKSESNGPVGSLSGIWPSCPCLS